MGVLSPKRVSEAKTITFRYAADLATGVTLSNPVVTKACIKGSDTFNADGAILGLPQIADSDILVLFSAGFDGCTYQFVCEVQASDGQIHDKTALVTVRGRRGELTWS